MANQPSQKAPQTLDSLVATARPAKLVGARSTLPKTTKTLELVKSCEPQLLGPMPVTMIKALQADIRNSADTLNYGVKVQVQDADGVKIPAADVKELLDNAPNVQVNVAFQGSTERKVIHRKPKENTQD